MEPFINGLKSRIHVLPVSTGGCGMALLDWRSKKERDSGGLDTDSHIRRKSMLISRLLLLMMMGSFHAAAVCKHRHCQRSSFVSCGAISLSLIHI